MSPPKNNDSYFILTSKVWVSVIYVSESEVTPKKDVFIFNEVLCFLTPFSCVIVIVNFGHLYVLKEDKINFVISLTLNVPVSSGIDAW
jgi:hypothetical protein